MGDFSKISLCPPFSLFQKMRVLGDLSKIAITWAFGQFWSNFFGLKILSTLWSLRAYYLEDNAVCARVLLGLSNEGYVLGDF